MRARIRTRLLNSDRSKTSEPHNGPKHMMTAAIAESKQLTRALVLGGGGPVGRAWQAGLVTNLVAKGIALRTADLILGTSAGAIVGAQLALDLNLAIAGPGPGAPAPGPAPAPFNGMGELIKATAQASRTSASEPFRQTIGQFALKAATPSEDQSLQRLGILANRDWPANFRATAVNVRTGESIVWHRGSGAPLDRAVASSCALPGVWPPIMIGGERYMDGGIRSMLNADLAASHSAVIIVSCFALALPEGVRNEDREALNTQLNAEIASLRESGTRVHVITPSEGFLVLTQFGAKMLDSSLVPDAFQLGGQQALLEAARLDHIWYHN
jgi:NTE family protein